MNAKDRQNITQHDIDATARLAGYLRNKQDHDFFDYVGRCYEYAVKAKKILDSAEVSCVFHTGFSILKESEDGMVHLINHGWLVVNDPDLGKPFVFDPLHIFGVGGILVANFGNPAIHPAQQHSNDCRLMQKLLPKVHQQNRKNGHHPNYGGLFLNYYRRMEAEDETGDGCYARSIKWMRKHYKPVDDETLVYRLNPVFAEAGVLRMRIVPSRQTPFSEGMMQFRTVKVDHIPKNKPVLVKVENL